MYSVTEDLPLQTLLLYVYMEAYTKLRGKYAWKSSYQRDAVHLPCPTAQNLNNGLPSLKVNYLKGKCRRAFEHTKSQPAMRC